MPLKNKSEKSREIPKKKSRPTRSRKRENPKRPNAPAKRGAASEIKVARKNANQLKAWEKLLQGGVESEVTGAAVSKKKSSQLVFDESLLQKRIDDLWLGINVPWVAKDSLVGVGDFWRQHLPKFISVYGSFDDDFFPETGSRREKRKWVELRVQELLDSRKDDEMRIRNLEKVICHLLDALKK